ncbi:rab family GTPase [Selaginella moellendorffii]|uniref:Rab family GTPase n=1 Tax=Selaginella moellendorffii TaxID=88036 RepID=D8RPN0_SELML|nr:ras-related protein RABC1 isoform X2 [Selaginella moellendorffii]XP_002984529.1 ras-related protein RABC1 isoform X2 [Selaginella moellendorffii]EFJ14579.1 rab family GTPase [Selaginella moellendorffii]EFJ26280.1 rab family GTPase [Selaginella moellendorffii]|eukprot:XP_002973059.1 ras-related protein RABC1 isoform X2 [Selaginella moellendorffii]
MALSSSSSSVSGNEFDHLFKILLIGDSGVGKSSLLLRFTADTFDDLSPTIGVDFKLKLMTLEGKRLKLTIWDTAGQERFRTLTSSYYRGAQGVILVYDVTRRDTFTNLQDVWLKEVELYSTNQDCVKLLVGNKVDRDSERAVSQHEGIAFARKYGCLFLESSAKTRINVQQCFEELVRKILETPSLVAEAKSVKKNILRPGNEPPPPENAGSCAC